MNETKVLYLWRDGYGDFKVGPRRPRFSTEDWEEFDGNGYHPVLLSKGTHCFVDDSGMVELLDCEKFELHGIIKIKVHFLSEGEKYKRSEVRERVITGITVKMTNNPYDWDSYASDVVFYKDGNAKVYSCPEGFEEVLGISCDDIADNQPVKLVVEILEDLGVEEPTKKVLEECKKKWYWR